MVLETPIKKVTTLAALAILATLPPFRGNSTNQTTPFTTHRPARYPAKKKGPPSQAGPFSFIAPPGGLASPHTLRRRPSRLPEVAD